MFVRINGQTQNSNDLTNFITGLKNDNSFNDANIANVSLEEGVIKFTIDAVAKLKDSGGKNL